MTGPPLRERVMEVGIRAARPLLSAAASPDSKLGLGVAGRARATEELVGWAGRERDPARPLVWVHAPSVGEGLMAKAIMEALRGQAPAVQIVFTHFSPSARRILPDLAADLATYLPWDTDAETGRAVRALRPDVVACVRTEIWPVLTRAMHAAGGRVALVNAVLSAGSGRLSRAGRFLLGPLYASLDAVGAVAERDEALFRELGVPPERVRLTGDARFDQVWQRVRTLLADDARRAEVRRLVGADRADFTVVAGSTWPDDEERLIAASGDFASGRWVLVPHEPTPPHLDALEQRLRGNGLSSCRLSALEADDPPEPAPVIVVDRMGVLADLYAAADIAYVGGGFRRAGLHSVVEPAALGVPVLFGPHHGNAREAADLLAERAGFAIESASDLTDVLRRLTSGPDARRAAGERAREFVRSRLGGAEANARLIAALLRGSSSGEGSSRHT